MTQYFADTVGVEQIKARYRELAFKHHPDRGGDVGIMQSINQQYHERLKGCDSSTSRGSDGENHTYYYNEERESAIADKLAEVIGRNLPGIRIMLVGTWLWIDGETRPLKEQLKELGFRWHTKRQKWYWNSGSYRSRNSNADFSHIAAKYGYEEFSSEERKKLSA
ncbi:hypothetical protein IQ249_15315 [Lusitaniella coriacea LEGE 07157]|uniref:J domain-containing protein n=1 Tax=Lusitaniella coriacea LEGE 07157 TaxID=945747 RepID=A0A8J7E0V8_9CYAN|nr:hypothetical protein [Lusitaniella coriacea]MBE9117269.1 hypothetical protein [Lusitaniella coriacea LEGE 07157]